MKKISLILIITLIISSLPLIASAQSVDSYNKNINILCSIGIAKPNDVLSNKDTVITRAQFVRYAVRAGYTNADSLTVDDSLPFGDVSSSHDDYSYISAAVKLNLVNGSNGFFLPDKPISYYASAKIAIHVLGYELLAESYGGYPYGYIKCANELDIFKDCQISNMDALTATDVSKILVNILEADVFETTSIGNDGNEYTPTENLLTRRHRIYSHEGIVTANSYTSVTVPEGHGVSNLISVDDVLYYTPNETDVYKYLGMSVKIYYKEVTSSKREIVCILPSEENTILALNGKDIENATLTSLTYSDNLKEKNSQNI